MKASLHRIMCAVVSVRGRARALALAGVRWSPRALALAGAIAIAASPRAAAAEPTLDGARSTAYAGFCRLDMAERGTGDEGYAGFRCRPRERSILYAECRYLDRFEEREARLLGGASSGIAGVWNLAAELSIAPGAAIYPRFAGSIELGRPVARSLALSGRLNASAYRDAALFGAALTSEYYPRGDCALISRIGVATIDFEGAPASTDGSALVKVIWFVDDRTRVFAYGASGSESYRMETIDRAGDIRSDAVGAGAAFFLLPSVAVSPSIEYQKRERGPRFLQFGLEISFVR
jgi:YaiO family outer membrane protein